jgi:integrase/recombinase XerC
MTREKPMKKGWEHAITDYADYLAASGAAASTVKLRRYYLDRLAKSLTSPYGVHRVRAPRPEPTPAVKPPLQRSAPHHGSVRQDRHRVGGLGPYQVAAEDLVRFQATPGWKAETRKSARTTIRGFYSWAYETGRIGSDPSASLPHVKVPMGTPRPTPVDVVTKALQRADRDGRLMICLAVLAGLRRSEIARVHSRDIVSDIVGHSLRVNGKGGKVRVVPLHPRIVHELGGRQPGFIFPGKDDGHLSPLWVGKKLARLLGDGWSGHTLRHRFSTSAYEVGHDLLSVQALMGHSSPTTTKRYTALDDESLRATIRGIAA